MQGKPRFAYDLEQSSIDEMAQPLVPGELLDSPNRVRCIIAEISWFRSKGPQTHKCFLERNGERPDAHLDDRLQRAAAFVPTRSCCVLGKFEPCAGVTKALDF